MDFDWRLIISIGTILFSVGAFYGIVKKTTSALTTAAEKLADDLKSTKEKNHELELALGRMETKLLTAIRDSERYTEKKYITADEHRVTTADIRYRIEKIEQSPQRDLT